MYSKYFSIVFQIIQECIFNCGFCNRRFIKGEKRLTEEQRIKAIDILKPLGLKRLTITGGEPMLIKTEVTNLLKYLHAQKIHTCLSTTGYMFSEKYLEELNNVLDHLLISFPTYEVNEWESVFGNKKFSKELYINVFNILEWCKTQDIILEVSTVIQKNNYHEIRDIGHMLAKRNSNIIWRIEYYYPMGIQYHLKDNYEITRDEIFKMHEVITTEFKGVFKSLYLSQPTRDHAPDLFITPAGDLVNTSNNSYSKSTANVLSQNLAIDFKMRRSWDNYKIYCRNWDNY
jgi:MoaA/NifB/PqqE/SkfB family radical SAM enzyme